MFNIPIAFIIYKRLNTTERVFRIIQLIKPKKIYLIADGPKSDSESTPAKMLDLSWNPILIGIANQLKYIPKQSGLCKTSTNWVRPCFQMEQMAIILEDDTC